MHMNIRTTSVFVQTINMLAFANLEGRILDISPAMATLATAISTLVVIAVVKLFSVPRNLSHLPTVPLRPLLWSLLMRESEDERTRNVIIAFANAHGYPVVLVWTFGLWVVHIVDHKVIQIAWKDPAYIRQHPSPDSLFWRFVGKHNILFTDGEEWKMHAKSVHAALQRPAPIAEFSAIAKRLVNSIKSHSGTTKCVAWDQMAQRVTLDVLGSTILGYDFRAMEDPNSPFVNGYTKVVHSLTEPLYMFFPILDKYFPRRVVEKEMQALREFFQRVLDQKRKNIGDDVISAMLQEPDMKDVDLIDNMVVLFIAGHDTTSSALASVIYYLAKYPEHQTRAREEVLSLFSGQQDLTADDIVKMPFVAACIKESMRMNDPSNITLTRAASTETNLAGYLIPPNTHLTYGIYASHHMERFWSDHSHYRPERFLENASLNQLIVSAFSVGPRACPAKNFAMWELRTLLTIMLVEFEWSLPNETIHVDKLHNGFAFGININQPKDLDIYFRPRT
ncbi:hypothetical protein VKT23_006903 [Stygiomarasmius scandens]|uniref:Cytochrome P450 n=1 Tax=Marasmiellus scandens TaxID=2682957 RepID=A0ABR1JPG4_9AGAR